MRDNEIYIDEDIAGLPKEAFPEFLFDPMITDIDIDDKYHNPPSDRDDQIFSDVLKIRRRYNNIYKYIHAIDIYNRYMEELITLYGSKKAIKSGIKEGYIDEYIPPKPKIKKSKENKAIIASGKLPSRVIEDADFENINNARVESDINNISMDTREMNLNSDKKIDKRTKESIKKASREISRSSRVDNLFATKIYGSDVFIDFINQTKNGGIDKNGKYKEIGIFERIEILEDQRMRENSLVDYSDDDGYSIIHGKYVRNKDLAAIEIYEELLVNSGLKINVKATGINKQAIKLVKRKHGLDETANMSKKELKKWKKKNKEKAKLLKERARMDESLGRILTSNKLYLDSEDLDMSYEGIMGKKKKR